MPPFAKLCSLLCLLLITACTSTEPTNDAEIAPLTKDGPQLAEIVNRLPKNKSTDSWDEEWKEWKEKSEARKVPANLFPTATRVRVYQGIDFLKISDKGKATTQLESADGNSSKEVPAKGGEWLSKAEIKTLRKSINFTVSPPAVTSCCVPRHGFVFYDKTGKYLGNVKVCYHCGCVEIHPWPTRDSELDWIDWDAAALQKIIEAHHLKVRSR